MARRVSTPPRPASATTALAADVPAASSVHVGHSRPLLSIVVPIYNEEAVFGALHQRVVAALDALGETFEVVFVNDGSVDESAAMLDELSARDLRFTVVHFSRNFGHQAAVTAGLRYAIGDCVIVLDADLQDPPELITALVAKWREGFEVVYGRRVSREAESLAKRGMAYLYYRALQRLSDVQVPADVGDFCLMDRRVVDLLNAMPERNRYVRGLRAWVGFRQTAVEFERRPRQAGEAKYSFRRSVALAVNGIVSLSKVPLRLAAYLGFVVSTLSFLLAVAFVIARLAGTGDFVRGWASMIVVALFLGGVQLVCLGVIGEYISRIYDEVKQRPLYVVSKVTEAPRPGASPRAATSPAAVSGGVG